MTGRLLAVLGMLAAGAGSAAAAPKRKVKIETEPPGATVYLNAKEDGPVCTTPCTIDAPVGDTPIIVELENHKQLFENLVVPKKKSVTVKYKLVAAIGTLIVRGPTGARISVDDIDKGKAPAKLDVFAGAHNVVLTLDGKKVANEFVDVVANEETTIEGKVTKADPPPDLKERVADQEGPDVTTDVAESVVVPEAPRARSPYASLTLAMDVGFRSFTYQNGNGVAPEKEGGQVLVGPILEVFPGSLAGIRALRRLAVFMRFGYGVNSQKVKLVDGSMTGASTFWRAFELGLRHRWTIASAVTFEVRTGYVRDQYQFAGNAADIQKVPDADYQSMMVGARVSVLLGKLEPYALVENRIVFSGGALQDRFDKTSANGIRGVVGVVTKIGSVDVHVSGALNRYSWTFDNSEMKAYDADGGTDQITFVSAGVGYTY